MWRNGDAMVECFGGSKTALTIDGFLAEADTGSRALLRRCSCTAPAIG